MERRIGGVRKRSSGVAEWRSIGESGCRGTREPEKPDVRSGVAKDVRVAAELSFPFYL